MELTDERKAHIDEMDVYQLLRAVRFSPVGNRWMQGPTGEYWFKRLSQLRSQDPGAYVRASKALV